MPKYVSSQYLIDIEAKFDLIKSMHKLSLKGPYPFESEKLLASYYVVEVCSGLENAAKSTIRDLVSAVSAPMSLKYHLLESKYLPSAQHHDLCDFIARLDPKIKDDYKRRVSTIEKDAMASLYANRQRIVHYGDSTGLSMTIGDVEQWRKNSAWLIRKMETSLRKTLR